MSIYRQALIEIITTIEIDGDFTVRHPHYPALELSPTTIARFKRTSSELQVKYAIGQIQKYLYDIYFSHSLLSLQEIESRLQQTPQFKNNIIDGIDIDFYQQLERSNTSSGYLDPDWQIVAETETGELIVVKEELHLHIDRQKHLSAQLQQAQIGDVVTIYLPHNLIGQDTYIAVGNSGTPDTSNNRSPSVEVYFNFTPEAAISISGQLTTELNQLEMPFELAIFHNPDLFHCYDAGTLWLLQTDYLRVQTVLADIYYKHQSQFSPNIPLFTKQLAPGLGLAEVPITDDTFGMQRCELLATGLFAMMNRDLTIADKLQIVCQEFTNAGIDWLQPYLNPSGLDYYPSFLDKTNTIKSD